MDGPPAINARRDRQVRRKTTDDGRRGRGEGGGEKSERYERKVVIERANFSTCGQWKEEREGSEEDGTQRIHGVLRIKCLSEQR